MHAASNPGSQSPTGRTVRLFTLLLLLLFAAATGKNISAATQHAKTVEHARPAPSQEESHTSKPAIATLRLADGTEIAMTEVVPRLQSALATLEQINSSVSDDDVHAIQTKLHALSADIASSYEETDQNIRYARSTQALGDVRIEWLRKRDALDALNTKVQNRVAAVTEQQKSLLSIQDTWGSLNHSEEKSAVPEILWDSIARLQTSALQSQKIVDTRLDSLVSLQVEIASSRNTVSTVLSSIDLAQKSLRNQIVELDSPPLWSVRPHHSTSVIREQIKSSAVMVAQRALTFYRQNFTGLFGFALFIVVLTILAARLRSTARCVGTDTSRGTPHGFLARPVILAGFIALFLFRSFFPQAPPEVMRIANLLLIAVSAALAWQVLQASIIWPVLAIGFLRAMDNVSSQLVAGTPLRRFLSILIAALSILVIARSFRSDGPFCQAFRRLKLPGCVAARNILLTLFSVALFANVIGNVSLSEVILSGTLQAVYSTLVIYLFYVVSIGILLLFVDSQFGKRSRVIRFNRQVFVEHATWIMKILCVVAWVLSTLLSFRLSSEAFQRTRDLLNNKLTLGTLSISAKDVLLFIVVLGIGMWIARVFRFLLDKEILPRTKMQEGAAQASSKLIYYALVTIGFFWALGAAGVDLSKLTLLTGAFGVGLGFGMQNIVSNFVSGIIISVERPMHINDIIEIGPVLGTVTEIGFRSSTVRTADGADVIVPNSELTMKSFVNWSLTDRFRRGEVKVGVAYGSDPSKVIQLLEATAGGNPSVLQVPPPQVTFEAFGDSRLEFTVRFWTIVEELATVRSELTVAISNALKQAAIEIPFPQTEVHLNMPNHNVP